MLLVCCLANLRTYNFMDFSSNSNQLRYLTYYEWKDLVGRVMPAIASANAIAAALELRELINIATGRLDRLRIVHFTNSGSERLSPCFQSGPLLSCNFCSPKVIYSQVELDWDVVTFRQFEEFEEKELFSFGRDLYSGPYVIIRNSKKTATSNKDKPIAFVK
jgi:hypothetical protein